MKTEHLSIRIPADLKASLQAKADAERRTLSNYVEKLLSAAVTDKRRPTYALGTHAVN